MDDGYRMTSRLLEEDEPPTALFCIRDRVAAGAIHAAASAGVEVPQQLSVIGFDDEDFFAETLTPPLTTIALPHEQMGERAVSALLAQIEPDVGPMADIPDGWRVLSACPPAERASVANAPARGTARMVTHLRSCPAASLHPNRLDSLCQLDLDSFASG